MSQVIKQSIPILMYHSIAEQATDAFRPFAVSPAMFEQQISYLQQQGYVSLTVTQLISYLSQPTPALPERVVVLTFDDGFADFFSDALPILKRYNFVATLYIATACIGSTSTWLWREGEANRLMLNWEQIVEIQAQGIECGAHTHTHPQLDLVPLSTARLEIVQSKDLLEQHLQQPMLSFAYPHGYHTPAVQKLVRDAGFTTACAVKYEMSHTDDDRFALARLLAGPNTGPAEMAALLTTPPPSAAATLYKQARVPVWRLLRHYSSFVEKRQQAKGEVHA